MCFELCIWQIVSILFNSFCGVLFLLGGACFFVSSFWLNPCVCFCALNLLPLLVFIERYYVVDMLWGPVAQSSWSPKLLFQVCSLCGLCVTSYCSWALIAIGTSMERMSHETDWLWEMVVTTLEEHCAEVNSQNPFHLSGVLVPVEFALWVYHLWRGLGGII